MNQLLFSYTLANWFACTLDNTVATTDKIIEVKLNLNASEVTDGYDFEMVDNQLSNAIVKLKSGEYNRNSIE